MTSTPARGAWGLAACVAAALVAGCTSVGPAPGGSAGPATTAPATTAPSTSAAAATSSAAPSSSAAPVTAVATSASSATAPASPSFSPAQTAGAVAPASTPRSTCTSLGIRVLRGSAAPGFEFAALQFENTGTTRCTLYGYPTVSLLSGGQQIGADSVPDGSLASAYVLAPGQVAESRLRDLSTCQAPLSDQIQVVAPRSSAQLVRPIQLRACALKVSRLDAPQ